jgi:hypothetical protein
MASLTCGRWIKDCGSRCGWLGPACRLAVSVVVNQRVGEFELSIYAVETSEETVLRTIGLALDIVVTRAEKSSLDFFNARRCGVVIGLGGLLPDVPGWLRRRRDRDILRSIDKEDCA